nr:dnaJ homolog subfamily C member 1 [Onthophagus taurus]
MYYLKICFALLLFTTKVNNVFGFDSDQLEVFDVVEEVKVNFYEAFNITQNASLSDIKSAFRRQSLLLHPDKNPGVDTSEQFRHVVAIYDVLKDANKRKYYDEVLVNGLPNWKSAVYYYRYVRKMGLLETSIILFIIITIGQYLVAWGAYFEKKLTLDQVKGKKQKKIVATIEIPKPSFLDTLPFQIPKWTIYFITSIPSFITYLYSYFKQKAIEKVEEIIQKEEQPEETIVLESKTIRRRKPGFKIPEGPNFETTTNYSSPDNIANTDSQPPPISGGLWTDDDLEQLISLVKKYPGGTSNRWELISEALNRSVPEVTYMANKMKNNAYRLPNQQEEEPSEPIKVKQKTKGGKLGVEQSQNNWSQIQQKALEDALVKFPKGCLERWDRISENVPDKTREECMLRYKSLVEAVKNKDNLKEFS